MPPSVPACSSRSIGIHIGVTTTVHAHVRLRLQRQAIDLLGNALGHLAKSTAEGSEGDDPPTCAAAVR
ncbi:hypothetical protein [Streptomyces sp. LUP47B]|uniref:hypothetical protein n=1 Tax=Streptomyces sp. LUP47B TaxID=1890286 RepID=UPI000851D126|nr:hypothetical protein [Streptomyces sp. LUP47B]